jgi:hypothetical protein
MWNFSKKNPPTFYMNLGSSNSSKSKSFSINSAKLESGLQPSNVGSIAQFINKNQPFLNYLIVNMSLGL